MVHVVLNPDRTTSASYFSRRITTRTW
jgi:hypothetical protein